MFVAHPARCVGLLIFATALAGWPRHATAQPAQQGIERFSKVAPEKWEAYEDALRHTQAKIEKSVYRTSDGETNLIRRSRSEMKQCGDWALIKLTETGPEQKGLPWGNTWLANSKYWAYAEQRQENGGWLLVKLDQRLVDGRPPNAKQVGSSAVRNVAHLLTLTGGLTLPGLMKRKALTVRQTAQDGDGERWVRINFSFRRDIKDADPERRADPDFEGTAVLDTSASWVIKRAELKLTYLGGYPAEQSIENEYRIGGDGVPMPVRATRKSTYFTDAQRSKSVREVEEMTFECVQEESVPEIEFSLTALELPEPVGVTFPQPTRWYLWLILAGACSLGAAIGLFKLATRRGTRTHAAEGEAT